MRENSHDYINGSALAKDNLDFEILNQVFFFWNAASLLPRHFGLHESATTYFLVSKDQQQLSGRSNYNLNFSRAPPGGAASQPDDA